MALEWFERSQFFCRSLSQTVFIQITFPWSILKNTRLLKGIFCTNLLLLLSEWNLFIPPTMQLWGYTGIRSVHLSVDAILSGLLLLQFCFNFIETLYEALWPWGPCICDFPNGRTSITRTWVSYDLFSSDLSFYEFSKMPFELTSRPAIYQRFFLFNMKHFGL